MLSSLCIQNYALIASLQVHFDKGMTVITGETGAGKSIIMGALSLVLGNRADTNILFDKSKKCIVEASFDISTLDLLPFFEANNLDYQNTTVIRREITPAGKSRAFINDTPVTLPLQKEFSSRLLNIHSQHQNLLFQDAKFRTDVVDTFAGIKPQVSEYQNVINKLRKTERDLEELREAQRTRLERQDFLQFVYQELESANLQENEQEDLEQQVDFLTHTETIKANLFQIQQLISESENSALDSLRNAQSLSAAISSYRSDIQELHNRLESSFIDLKDISSEVSSLYDRVDFEPEELERMRERLDLIYNLEQKHHVTTFEQLLEKKNAIGEELDSLTVGEEKMSALDKECQQLKKEAQQLAQKLHQHRQKAIPALQKLILSNITQLGMPDAQFVIDIQTHEEMNAFGIDSLRFLFSANPGVAPAPLEKVASGGEISRLMLALKASLSDRSVLPTVVFDEIDVGISGEMAGKVASLMRQMSDKHQLIVITHLPQIAAAGTSHYQVFKETADNQVHTQVKLLSNQERTVEIAKMMSGEKWGNATLMAAQELIDH